MSDTDADRNVLLSALRTKRRELELDHVQLAGRILEINECIALIEHGPRRRSGRPRVASVANPYQSQPLQQSPNTAAQNIVPQRVAGGMASAEADLPSLDEARGILKIPEDAA